MADSLFNSKIRYGLQLLGKVRTSGNDGQNQDLLAIQKVQNKLIRFLNNKRISDKISTDTLISNINMTSVNRMNAQIKLTETWKAIKTEKCPLNIKVPTIDQNKRVARSSANGMLKTNGYSDGTKSTFINDSKKTWNSAPREIKDCKTMYTAKAAIKKYVNTLPL